MQTNNYSAQFGHSAGAVLNASTKSGTNPLHGDLWEFVRNDKFDAADFFLNASGAKKAELRQNQFGFTVGGPAVIPHVYDGRNKTFFFGYYQGSRNREGSSARPNVPTLAERASGYANFQDLIGAQSGTRNGVWYNNRLSAIAYRDGCARHSVRNRGRLFRFRRVFRNSLRMPAGPFYS